MKLIQLTKGLSAKVDDADYEALSIRKWHAVPRRDGNGFYAANASGRKMHRVLLGAVREQVVDHRNGDGLDNQRSNIRIGTQALNCVNRQRTPGVHLRGVRPKKGRWQAYIKQAGKQKSLGYFGTPEQAHAAYLAEATKRYGDWMPLPPAPVIDQEGQ